MLNLKRVSLGSYGSAVNAQRRLDELQGAFENESDEWSFVRENVNRDTFIFVYYPTDWSSHDDIFAFIRSKSIAYRKEQRELAA